MIPDRRLAGTTVTHALRWRDQHGEPAAPGGTVTATVTSLRSGVTSPVTPSTVGDTSTVTLDGAAWSEPDDLTFAWSVDGVVRRHTRLQLVGAVPFTLTEARVSDPTLGGGRWPDELLREARHVVEVECERITGRVWVPVLQAWVGRARAGRIRGPHEPRQVVRVLVDDMPQDPAAVTATPGFLDGSWRDGARVTVIVEAGPDVPPADLRAAMLLRLRHLVAAARSAIPDRATSFAVVEGGVFRLAQPGALSTGQPDVDAVYHRYRVAVPVG